MRTWRNGFLLGAVLLVARFSNSQTMAEYGAKASQSGVTAQTSNAPAASPTNHQSQGSSPHLLAPTGPPPDEVNRKNFEDNAGETRGKLLLRSAPSGAEVFVNGLIVGRTPLLMVIAPGTYKIDMRGSRDDWGHAQVGIMPRESQTTFINLAQRYPSKFAIH